jgi:phage gp45-like
MHRATPLNTSIRAYTAGGSRCVLGKADDSKLMQEVSSSIMHNEERKEIEAAQNYGFTSVHFDPEQDQNGKTVGAESFLGFMGGNRSFPASGPTDDRRHRLYKLEAGDSAMFRGRGDKQQFHLTKDGGFWTAPQDKTVRMQLVESDSESNATVQQGGGQQGGGTGASTRAGDSGDSSQQQQGGGQQKRGQEALYKDGQKCKRFVDVTKDKTRASGSQVHLMLDDDQTYVHCHTDKQVYVGGEAGKHTFSKIVTLDGPCSNSLGRIA